MNGKQKKPGGKFRPTYYDDERDSFFKRFLDSDAKWLIPIAVSIASIVISCVELFSL